MDRKLLLLGLLRTQEMHGYQLKDFILRSRIPRSLLRGTHAQSKACPAGENSVILRLLAAEIGIFKGLLLY
jgi:hypothetical protein